MVNSMSKEYLLTNVYCEAKKRVSNIFDDFKRIYLSFSGGKDSSVMMHMVCEEARKRKRKIGLLFIDLEAQYKITIEHIEEMKNEYADVCDTFHVCLPIILRNAVSVYEPRWCCWDDNVKETWVRELPEGAIHDVNHFPFFKKKMEFEEFTEEFGEWYSKGEPTACFVGIRTDESLNRFRTIRNKKKQKHKNNIWTTKINDTTVYNAYPIYDWQTRDIWIYNYKYKKLYNKLYDLMHQAGLTIHQQRICQPYGDDQRKGLWLYQVIEPDTWSKVVSRVSGANSGSEFVTFNGSVSGQIKITKPDNKTWKEFARVLVESMPENMKEHYSNKIFTYLKWYSERGFRNDIPDYNIDGAEVKEKPSWKRICKMLLRNDYWAKSLSFSQTKAGYFYKKYMERKKRDRQKYFSKKTIGGKKWF